MTKRALVLSGGGAKGAFQAGALSVLRRDYDIFCGISVGALNAGYLAQHTYTPKGAAKLAEMWRNTNTKDIYKSWFGWLLAALWKSSVYNSAPLREMIEKEISAYKLRLSGKQLKVGAVSIPQGDYTVFTQNDKDIIDGILASSAFPAMLTPVEINGTTYTDGGLRVVTPISEAISLGATEVDVIMTSPRRKSAGHFGDTKVLGIARKSLEIIFDENIEKDLKIASLYNKLVRAGVETDKREVTIRVLRPRYELGDPLNFDNAKIRSELAWGEKQAIEYGFEVLR